jgi:hypothetical protein
MSNHKIEWREHNKDWNDDHPGWHQHKINAPDEFVSHSEFVNWYNDIVDWLYSNIQNCERHCRWAFEDKAICIKFRYEKDYLLCALRY